MEPVVNKWRIQRARESRYELSVESFPVVEPMETAVLNLWQRSLNVARVVEPQLDEPKVRHTRPRER
jgi:hypothetical protein